MQFSLDAKSFFKMQIFLDANLLFRCEFLLEKIYIKKSMLKKFASKKKCDLGGWGSGKGALRPSLFWLNPMIWFSKKKGFRSSTVVSNV